MVPRALRFICFGFEMRRCRLWATFALTLPVPVRLKRFFAPLLVFNLGIFGPWKGLISRRQGMPSGANARARRRAEPRLIAAPSQQRKDDRRARGQCPRALRFQSSH